MYTTMTQIPVNIPITIANVFINLSSVAFFNSSSAVVDSIKWFVFKNINVFMLAQVFLEVEFNHWYVKYMGCK